MKEKVLCAITTQERPQFLDLYRVVKTKNLQEVMVVCQLFIIFVPENQ
jgi:hypothetical protein